VRRAGLLARTADASAERRIVALRLIEGNGPQRAAMTREQRRTRTRRFGLHLITGEHWAAPGDRAGLLLQLDRWPNPQDDSVDFCGAGSTGGFRSGGGGGGTR
jgi:hypothetical protein